MRRLSVVTLGLLCALTVPLMTSPVDAMTPARALQLTTSSTPDETLVDEQDEQDEQDAPAWQPVSECVTLSQELVERGLHVELSNNCVYSVRCELSWSIHCDADASPHAERQTTTLHAGASTAFHASAAVCDDEGWEVTSDRWDCVEIP